MIWLAVFMLIAFIVAVCAGINRAERDLWDEKEKKEAERQARVKALYPEPPSYEERMGVSYGRDGTEDKQGIQGGDGGG